jgi:hypothetical protein
MSDMPQPPPLGPQQPARQPSLTGAPLANKHWFQPRRSWRWWTTVGMAAVVVLIVVAALAAPPKKAPVANIPVPTVAPTVAVAAIPPDAATVAPTAAPTVLPTAAPTAIPTAVPTPAAVLAAPDGDLGGTLNGFTAVHGVDSGPGAICSDANVCFGPRLVNDESAPAPTYEFTSVGLGGGIVTDYDMNFANGTTIADAKAEVLRWLPQDTAATLFGIDHNGGSCAIWNLRSRTLARVLGAPSIGDPSGILTVEFSYIDANLNTVYEPNNVESASILIIPGSLSDMC